MIAAVWLVIMNDIIPLSITRMMALQDGAPCATQEHHSRLGAMEWNVQTGWNKWLCPKGGLWKD